MCREAVDRAAGARRILLRVHPRDADLLAGLPWLRSLELLEDETLSRGGCMVESEQGIVDGRIETRLDSLERALEETMRAREATEE